MILTEIFREEWTSQGHPEALSMEEWEMGPGQGGHLGQSPRGGCVEFKKERGLV